MTFYTINRRRLLSGAAFGALAASAQTSWAASTHLPGAAKPVPLSDVRLLPSPYKTAVDVNEKYLLTLSPDRFLHNFRKGAGLAPKAEAYGGWEQDTIAGHSLGHYLSAIALMHAQTGDEVMKQKAAYIVEELITIQAAQGDGYVAGFTRKRPDGSIVDGKEIF
ncbi:MAG: beta-L-arabinofuranosidase domain-containing protein, partial [Rhizomicrobium sp.]